MSQAIWEVVTPADEAADAAQDAAVFLSADGLRRAYDDNALLAATARTHEILAGTACGLIVVAIVWAIFRSL